MSEVINKLTIIELKPGVREIVSKDTKLRLARIIDLENCKILIIDVVEKRFPTSAYKELVLKDGRKLLYEKIDEVRIFDRVIRDVELVYYQNPNRTELISIRLVLEESLNDCELLNIYISILQMYAPSYFERLRKVLNKYVM